MLSVFQIHDLTLLTQERIKMTEIRKSLTTMVHYCSKDWGQ